MPSAADMPSAAGLKMAKRARGSRLVGSALACGLALLAFSSSQAAAQGHTAGKTMPACMFDAPPGREVSSLLCLNDGVAGLSEWKERSAEEQAWHDRAAKASHALSQQAARMGHPEPRGLFYGSAILSFMGVPHAVPNQQKKALCDQAEAGLVAGCRYELCRAGESAPSDELIRIERWYRNACIRQLPRVCQWDPKTKPSCGASWGEVQREWSAYSQYLLALPRLGERAEGFLPLLDAWRVALESYEKQVTAQVDEAAAASRRAAAGSGGEPSKLSPTPPPVTGEGREAVLSAGLKARQALESALWESVQAQAQSKGPKAALLGLMNTWKQLLRTPEANDFEPLHRFDAEAAPVRAAAFALLRLNG